MAPGAPPPTPSRRPPPQRQKCVGHHANLDTRPSACMHTASQCCAPAAPIPPPQLPCCALLHRPTHHGFSAIGARFVVPIRRGPIPRPVPSHMRPPTTTPPSHPTSLHFRGRSVAARVAPLTAPRPAWWLLMADVSNLHAVASARCCDRWTTSSQWVPRRRAWSLPPTRARARQWTRRRR